MNDLNSVLIEGTVMAEPFLTVVEGNSKCHLRIESRRFDKVGDAICEERDDFDIILSGHQAEISFESLEKGRGVRVVGRLRTQGASVTTEHVVFIEATHIEFKPKKVGG